MINGLLKNKKTPSKRKMGRPKKDENIKMSSVYNHSLHVKISDEQREMFETLALNNGCSIATLVRRMIEIEYGQFKAGLKGDL